jgi:hypothetical protein
MHRRTFVSGAGLAAIGSAASVLGSSAAAQDGTKTQSATAGSLPGESPLLGSAVVSGPAAEAITILQPLARHATGFLEFAINGGEFQRVDASFAGLQPFEAHVLKFRLPPLPGGAVVSYRITARTVGWVQVDRFYHGRIVTGEPVTGPTSQFKTLDRDALETKFVVWNDTHENLETLRKLHLQTTAIAPDFLLWNGDQTNDVHFENEMTGQFLAPAGLAIADHWPLAYVRGNHDVRGPEARRVRDFTGTPEDRFYYAFRSGPVAALVMDTGEDKPDDSPYFGGLTAFGAFRERQAAWLLDVVKEPWFREAPHKVLFCHLPLWWVRDRKDIDWWEFSKVSRDVWLPGLLEGEVKLVISGHTHSPAWMPAKEGQPLGQLIGGGPQPGSATLIYAAANPKMLSLTMRKLDGSIVQRLELPA